MEPLQRLWISTSTQVTAAPAELGGGPMGAVALALLGLLRATSLYESVAAVRRYQRLQSRASRPTAAKVLIGEAISRQHSLNKVHSHDRGAQKHTLKSKAAPKKKHRTQGAMNSWIQELTLILVTDIPRTEHTCALRSLTSSLHSHSACIYPWASGNIGGGPRTASAPTAVQRHRSRHA